MPVTSLGLRESGRTLPHDTPHQSSSPLVLRPGAIERRSGLPTIDDTSLPHDPPRLSTAAARARAVRLGTENAQAQTGILDFSSTSPILDNSPVSPAEVSDDEYTPPRRSSIGPVRSIKSHSRRQPPGHIPRPKNAFILYRSWYVKQGFLNGIEASVYTKSNDHREISRIVGRLWKEMSEKDRQTWRVNAEEEKKQHALKHPNYKYSPNARRDNASVPLRSAPARASTTRSRKTKTTDLLRNDRLDGIVAAFSSGSHRQGLEDRAQQQDNHTTTATTPEASPRSAQLEINVQPPTPQPGPNSGGLLAASLDSSPTTSSQVEGGQADNSSAYSLAACSAPLVDPEFTPNPEASGPNAMYYPHDLGLASSWPFRQGFNGSETLNTIMSCDNSTAGYDPANDSTYYHQYSVTEDSNIEQPASERTGLLPFNRFAPAGSQPGCLDSLAFGTSFNPLPTDHDLTGSFFDSLQQSALAEGFPASTSMDVDDSSTQDQSDSLLEDWFTPDSPVFADDVQTPTASMSSGAPSPPLPLETPTPTYPQHNQLLCSWATDYRDLDAYRYAAGGVRAETDDCGAEFGMGELNIGSESN
ncbi:hypothetical protein FRC07_008780 [Ceratobasidium sp. 392]|nr:hypothetical protein FRC07_008780 [Ceratobasidium sp. 392]